MALLRGAERLIRQARPMLLVELNPKSQARAGYTCDALFSLIEGLAYRAILLRGGRLFPVKRYYSPEETKTFASDVHKERCRYDNYLFVPVENGGFGQVE